MNTTDPSARHPTIRIIFATLFLCAAYCIQCPTVVGQNATKPTAKEIEFFESKVRPLLVQHCYECHSAKAKEPKGGLRVDGRAFLLAGGDTGPAIEPGNQKSLLLDAIGYGDLYQMPPKTKLPQQEIDIFKQWVKMGAPWPAEENTATTTDNDFDIQQRISSHWAWTGPKQQRLPRVKNKIWPQQQFDHFILEKLEDNDLQPNLQANRSTLIRRAYFDITGLPPTPAAVQSFIADPEPTKTAFAKIVDQLLASDHFGERWARHWMDLVRYGESYGHEFDYTIPHAYKYRDYLIRAINEDVPYDQFITEQIAGDLMPSPRFGENQINQSLQGTGFWWMGEAVHAPVDVVQDEADRIDNQIDVLGKTFLGVTVACARCHDHKFDAISTKDYYALAGFLQSSRRDIRALYPAGTMKPLVQQMAQLQLKLSADVASKISAKAVLDGENFSRYLLAVREINRRKIQFEIAPDDTVVFEDFESPDYKGWVVEGDAFGDRPITKKTQAPYQGMQKAHGLGWVNSHNIHKTVAAKTGDSLKGRLLSPTFKIEHRYLHFLICGGSHKEKTCVNLIVDGKQVFSQTGFNKNEFSPIRWDLEPYKGKMAQLVIVDDQEGSWGNIGIDHILFSPHENLSIKNSPEAQLKVIAEVAAEFNVAADKLQLWFSAIISKETDPVQHPLHIWRQTMDVPTKSLNGQLQAAKKQNLDGIQKTADLLSNSPQLDGFQQWATQWYIDGESFPIKPTPSGTLDLRGEVIQLFKTGSIDSGQLSNKLQGTFRSPTFELNHNAIQMKLRGNGVESRLIIDGFFLYRFNGLLFRGFTTTANTPDISRWHRLQGDVSRYQGHTGYVEFIDQGNGSISIDDIRFTNAGSPPEISTPLLQHLITPQLDNHEEFALSYGRQWESALENWRTAQLDNEDVDLINWALKHKLIEVPEDMLAQLNEQWQQFKKLDSEIPKHEHVLVMADGNGENENVFVRGNHKVLGETAPRQLLAAIVGEKVTQSSGSGRLELAADIADANNPLTSRVMVNRIWHHLFGRGIVASTNNFGVLGQRPTHPELLDHLAQRFSDEHQWSVKDMIKEIMLSSTYQLSSTPNPKYLDSDPNNFLLYRQNIRRLQGEAIRDNIIAVSGRLDKKMYGPSTPVYLTPFMTGRGRPQSGPLDGAGRRSIYISVRRNFIAPLMLAFDTPVPFNSIGRRNVSNVPSQALILMNDPFVIEQSQVWAKRLAANDKQTSADRIDQMIHEAFGRPASKIELADAGDFLEIQREQYGIAKENLMTDIRLWADLGHVLINSKPFIYID
ncbi:MAG: PSD1 and planctomycete cytochrome C domain-containing protein [Pirellulaceae bacterium]|nr:PSD1 and planctomycete cytochrome C domain-containing protein [Pirellulaceae bacterium]